MPDERLIIFTRYPQAGKTKTRLIPTLGEEGAVDLHRRMARRTFETVKAFSENRPVRVEIHYEGGDEALMREWVGPDFALVPQADGHLGRRMAMVFQSAFDDSADSVVIIGTDCPSLTPAILLDAFDSLAAGGAVIGPATDGGYYVIGLTHPAPALFENIEWGTDKVLADTCSAAYRTGLAIVLLPLLADVDRPEDLTAMEPFE